MRPEQNYSGRYFLLEIPMKDSAFKDVYILLLARREGEGWLSFSEAIIKFAEAGYDKSKMRNTVEQMEGPWKEVVVAHARPKEGEKSGNPILNTEEFACDLVRGK